MHWMPSFSLMMPPNLASSTASSSAPAFFFRNFFSPLLSLLSVSAAAPARASVVFSNLLNAFNFTTCTVASHMCVSSRDSPCRCWQSRWRTPAIRNALRLSAVSQAGTASVQAMRDGGCKAQYVMKSRVGGGGGYRN